MATFSEPKLLQIKDLDLSEHFIIWGFREWLRISNAQKDPKLRLDNAFSKANLQDIAEPIDEMMKIVTRFSMVEKDILPMCCYEISKDELDFLNIISYIQHGYDYKGTQKLSKWLPKFILKDAFKQMLKISSILIHNHLFLPFRGEKQNLYIYEGSQIGKYKYH